MILIRNYISKYCKKLYVLSLLLITSFSPTILQAAIRIENNPPSDIIIENNPPGGLNTFQNPLAFKSLTDFLEAFLDVLIQIAFPFIVLAVIYTGFLFVKAQGNQDELQTAKRAFLWTVVGALVILGATAILALIRGTVDGLTG